jgi:crotonobetainyl-CoA hydratase
MVVQLRRAFAALDADPAVAGVVLSGGASASFCAGADLASSLVDGDLEPLPEGKARYLTSKPLVAAVRGWAVGVGMKLACSADLVVAAEDARFWAPETRVGILGAADIAHRLVRQLPYRVAMAVLLAGEVLPARRGLELGLVNALAGPACVEAEAVRLLQDMPASVTGVPGLDVVRRQLEC